MPASLTILLVMMTSGVSFKDFQKKATFNDLAGRSGSSLNIARDEPSMSLVFVRNPWSFLGYQTSSFQPSGQSMRFFPKETLK